MLKKHFFTAIFASAITLAAQPSFSACSDSEYKIYKKYDKYLDDNPNVEDVKLRKIFAKKVNMKPDDLRDLYRRCTQRWTQESPDEAQAYARKELEAFAKDCKTRPANDAACQILK